MFLGTTKTSGFSKASLGIGWKEQFSMEYVMNWFLFISLIEHELNFIMGILHPLAQVLCVLCSP